MIAGVAAALPPITEEPEPLRLADFITARYDDQERDLRCTCIEAGGGCGGGWCYSNCQTCSGGDREPRDCEELDDLAAKRAILAKHTPNREAADPWEHDVDNACTWYSDGDHEVVYEAECETLQILAWPFRAHVDYNPAWAKYLPESLTGEEPE